MIMLSAERSRDIGRQARTRLMASSATVKMRAMPHGNAFCLPNRCYWRQLKSARCLETRFYGIEVAWDNNRDREVGRKNG